MRCCSRLFLFSRSGLPLIFFFFFFNDTATTEFYPLPLPAALPISCDAESRPFGIRCRSPRRGWEHVCRQTRPLPEKRYRRGMALVPRGERRHDDARVEGDQRRDRKSTRLNSSHLVISYAVFCLKKK